MERLFFRFSLAKASVMTTFIIFATGKIEHEPVRSSAGTIRKCTLEVGVMLLPQEVNFNKK